MVAVPEEFDRDFEQAYRAHFPLLHRRSRRWLPPDEAEDAVQETFLRAWAKDSHRAPDVPWLLTVLKNLAIDRSRRKSAEPVGDMAILDTPLEDGPDAQVVALEDRRAVRRALEGLTEAQRAAINLREWAGMTHQEIADSLGTTVPSVESLLVRGRRRLRGALEKVMAVALWPATGMWRKLRQVPEAAAAAQAAPAATAALTHTVAQLATAAVVLVAGVAGGVGNGGDGHRGMGGADHGGAAVSGSEADRAAALVTIRGGSGGGSGGSTMTTGGSQAPGGSASGTSSTQALPAPGPGGNEKTAEAPGVIPPKDGSGPGGETPTHPQGDPPTNDPEVPTLGIDNVAPAATA
jgi:RNA polymerase sigma-70 factor (ECF subfamily)